MKTQPLKQKESWQQQLSDVVTDPIELCRLLQLDAARSEELVAVLSLFPLRVPRAFLSRIEPGNLEDPLLKQVLPLPAEAVQTPGYSKDPLNEASYRAAPGLLHKYHGRVLLTLTGACAIHCRYCFRRHYPYAETVPAVSQWNPALAYIQENPTIEEVLLSGGDPLVLKDDLLSSFIRRLEAIPHLKRLRIHTRLPIVIPNRVTSSLVTAFTQTRLQCIVVLHSNHPREIDEEVEAAIKKCQELTLLNQAVLLAGVNDNAETLVDLSQRLFECGVLPYYLHQLDPVAGAAHFYVEESVANRLMHEVSLRLPGYLVPKFVCETPGEGYKRLVELPFTEK